MFFLCSKTDAVSSSQLQELKMVRKPYCWLSFELQGRGDSLVGVSKYRCNNIISTDEDPDLWIESFAVINLRGVSTNKKYYMY